jgi:hypothetical protein
MMTTVSPDRHGYVSVQFGADGPFEMWHMEDLDLISEARFEMLRRGT